MGFKVTNPVSLLKLHPKAMPKMHVIVFPESSFQYFRGKGGGGGNSLRVMGEPMKTHDVKYRPNYFYAVSCLCRDESRTTHQSPLLITKITMVPVKDVFIYSRGRQWKAIPLHSNNQLSTWIAFNGYIHGRIGLATSQ